jgi:hypothetical protein
MLTEVGGIPLRGIGRQKGAGGGASWRVTGAIGGRTWQSARASGKTSVGVCNTAQPFREPPLAIL